MPELLLHYIWQKGLFRVLPQWTTDGRRVEVLDVGQHNHDAGPDFFAATVRIGGVTWTGNVEIHVKASDWLKHGHQTDAAYDSVVLHVVKQADKDVYNSRGEKLVQCELQYPDDPGYLERMLSDRATLCSSRIMTRPDMVSQDWKQILLRDRMQAKAAAVSNLLQLTQNAWDQAFYVTLAHNFGFHINGLPFEMLAKQTPLACLQKHKSSLFQLEAILFGQSGLLTEQTATDDYSLRLLKEYTFLRKKFSLMPLEGSIWKMLRMRPQNFPHVRIAQFAALLHQSEFLLSRLLEETDVKQLRALFGVTPSAYWQTHYRFGAEAPAQANAKERGALGKTAIDVLLINSVSPYKFAWGRHHMNMQMQDDSFRLLEELPAEKNAIITQWKMLGQQIRSAAESQAMLQLYQDYCLHQRCLSCDVGYQIFTPEKK